MSKNYKENTKSSYKPVIKVNNILKGRQDDPNKTYAWVRIDDLFDPDQRILQEEYLNNGWDLVVDDQKVEHDYDSTKSKDSLEEYKPVHRYRTGRGGAQFVFVSKDTEQYLTDERLRAQRDNEKFISSAKGRKVEKRGNNLRITDSEADPNYKLD